MRNLSEKFQGRSVAVSLAKGSVIKAKAFPGIESMGARRNNTKSRSGNKIEMIGWCMVACMLFRLLISHAFAANYYVDSTLGNDSRTAVQAQNPSTPWRNCPGMWAWGGSAALSAGDTLYFNNARTWSVDGSGWYILDVTGGVTYDGSNWGTGTRAKFTATGNLGRGVIAIIKDHATSETKVIGFEVDVNNQGTHGIVFDAGYGSVNMTGTKKTVQNCIVHNVGTGYFYGIYVSPWNSRIISNVDIKDCVVYTTPRSAINNYAGPQNGSITYNVTIRNCEAYDAGNDPGSGGFGINIKGETHGAVVEYNYCHDNHGGGLEIAGDDRTPGRSGPVNTIVRYNIFSNNAMRGIYFWEEGNKSGDIYGNLIFNNTMSGVYIGDSVVNDFQFRVYNNTFFHNEREIYIPSGVTATFTTFELRNNIFYAKSGYECIRQEGNYITAHNNNTYYRTSGALVYNNGRSYASANIKSSWEATAQAGNPTFKNESDLPTGFAAYIPNKDGLSLNPGSNSIDTGANLGISYNGSVNGLTRSGLWDIGAYEFALDGAPNPPTNLRIQ